MHAEAKNCMTLLTTIPLRSSCVVFASITHLSPLNIQYSYYDKISKEDKEFLQNIAKETVEDFYNIDL